MRRIYAKLESFNIGGSVKDRLALYVIEYAQSAGKLDKQKTNPGGYVWQHRHRFSNDSCGQKVQDDHSHARIGEY